MRELKPGGGAPAGRVAGAAGQVEPAIGKLDATVQLCVSDDVWLRDIKRTSRAIAVPAIDLLFKWSLTIPAEEGARKNVFSGEPAYGAENAGKYKGCDLAGLDAGVYQFNPADLSLRLL